jgi:predicted DNA-binding antitoxin AbrB/MazE fold protein
LSGFAAIVIVFAEHRAMPSEFEAIYENGILRPLTPLSLAENEHVTLIVAHTRDEDWLDNEYMDSRAADADFSLTRDQIKALTASIPGSMDEAIDEDRGER